MANVLYDVARKEFASKGIDWNNDSLAMLLIARDGTTYNVDVTHTKALDNIPLAARNYGEGTPAAYYEGIPIPNPTVSDNGACRCTNITFETIGASNNTNPIKAVVIYRTTDDTPIAYLDSATGLPITPNGGAIIVVPDAGTNGLFRL